MLVELWDQNIIAEFNSSELYCDKPVLHRPVIREFSLTTKVRAVFDASATGCNDISLNDCMDCCPNLIPYPVGYCAFDVGVFLTRPISPKLFSRLE